MIDYEIKDAQIFAVKTPLESDIYTEMSSWLKAEQKDYGDKRKQDFLAGRYCAKKALAQMGIDISHLGMYESRAPMWPTGIVGSITHTRSIAIAVVSQTLKGIGIDVECLMTESRYQNIKKMIVTLEEEKLINKNLKIYPTLVFSAKESLYKALYPLCLQYFGFLEATIIKIEDNKFTLLLHSNDPKVSKYNDEYHGNFSLHGEVLISSITIN